MTGERRGSQRTTALWLVTSAALGGILYGTVFRFGDRLPVVAAVALAAAIVIGVFLGIRPWWRKLDHMERDSRLMSWYWGGGLGGAIALVAALGLGGARSPLFAGAALVWLTQFFGYAAARLKWWFSYRSTAA